MDCSRLQRSMRTIRDAKQRLTAAAEASPEIAEPLRRAVAEIAEADRRASELLRQGIGTEPRAEG